MNIPAAALEAGARAIAESLRTVRLTTESQDGYKPEARAAFLAMINAWPGMVKRDLTFYFTDFDEAIILPLPTEACDDK